MTATPLILALPSKGRLKEQCEAWLASVGYTLIAAGGGRGYSATIAGVAGVSVQFLSASSIAGALDAGEAHLGVTGEDLLRERGEDIESRVTLLRPLGFGHADVVVAAPGPGSTSTPWPMSTRWRTTIWRALAGVCASRPSTTS